VTQLLEARDTRTLQRLHKQLERLDLLLLDELGYVPFSKAGAELLFEVVMELTRFDGHLGEAGRMGVVQIVRAPLQPHGDFEKTLASTLA